ncbi:MULTISPECIES: hypothetical protein [unclassified Nonomuraea]
MDTHELPAALLCDFTDVAGPDHISFTDDLVLHKVFVNGVER